MTKKLFHALCLAASIGVQAQDVQIVQITQDVEPFYPIDLPSFYAKSEGKGIYLADDIVVEKDSRITQIDVVGFCPASFFEFFDFFDTIEVLVFDDDNGKPLQNPADAQKYIYVQDVDYGVAVEGTMSGVSRLLFFFNTEGMTEDQWPLLEAGKKYWISVVPHLDESNPNFKPWHWAPSLESISDGAVHIINPDGESSYPEFTNTWTDVVNYAELWDHSRGTAVTFHVIEKDDLGTNNNVVNPFFTIYPNPAKDYIKIESTQSIQQVDIYDLLGKKILSSKNNQINISELQNAIYIVQVKMADGKLFSKKMIKN